MRWAVRGPVVDPSDALGQLAGVGPRLALDPGARPPPHALELAAGPDLARDLGLAPDRLVVVDVLADGVVPGPHRALDAGHVVADALLEQLVQDVADRPGVLGGAGRLLGV